jgi:hypothetical protein
MLRKVFGSNKDEASNLGYFIAKNFVMYTGHLVSTVDTEIWETTTDLTSGQGRVNRKCIKRLLVGKLLGKRPLTTLRRRWEGNMFLPP